MAARPRGNTIPLLGFNGEHLRYVTLKQAWQLIDGEQAVDVGGWRNRKDQPLSAIKLVVTRLTQNDPASITASEASRNALARGEYQHKDSCCCAECRAVAKIKWWPLIGDTRAVRVGVSTELGAAR